MKRMALINDLSGFGKCSLTAALPVISVMGIQGCPLPTAILTAQTEFDEYICDDYTDRMDNFTAQWKKMGVTFDGIYSGYLQGAEQIAKVLHFLDEFQTEDNIYLADPVLGTQGKPYAMCSSGMIKGMKELVKRADAVTPNLTELCMLADADYRELTAHRGESGYVKRVEGVCAGLLENSEKPQSLIVTGIIREHDGREYIGNLAISGRESRYVENPYTGVRFSGTGDLFASVISGSLVKGVSVFEAMEKATDFLREAIGEASADGIPSVHGVYYEKYLSKLL